ncbi:hypothetical protein C0J45_7098 [Silurus meridionalis]|nr:hypothetical protein C0J45_7098 [Silurus meridionalis]
MRLHLLTDRDFEKAFVNRPFRPNNIPVKQAGTTSSSKQGVSSNDRVSNLPWKWFRKEQHITMDSESLRLCFQRKIKARKAAGPDGISSRLLKTCADQLCGILLYMFDLSLKLGKVPQIWKTSCVVPVPKTPRPKDFGDYRPVALTSHLMKTLERLVLTHLRPLVSPSMDPLQFAYQPGIGVEDAVIFLLNRAISHLEKAGSTVRVMFFDFSSAFNTIQPALLRDKMVYMGVDHHLSAWTLDYLTDRPQYVRTRDCESDMIVCNTGAPQGTVLAPFLFTIYTADFMFSSETCHLQKFSDDSAIVGLITNDDDRDYRGLIKNFVDWCQRSCLQINAGKTKELVVDFRRNKQILSPVNIQGKDIVRVDSYKYLGVHLNNKLDWTDNTEAIYKKGQSRLFLLRRLRSFGVQGELLKTFFDSVVASAIFYGVVCWGSSISTADRKRLDKLIRKASSVLGIPLDTVQEKRHYGHSSEHKPPETGGLYRNSQLSHVTPLFVRGDNDPHLQGVKNSEKGEIKSPRTVNIDCQDQRGIVEKSFNLTCNVTSQSYVYEDYHFKHNDNFEAAALSVVPDLPTEVKAAGLAFLVFSLITVTTAAFVIHDGAIPKPGNENGRSSEVNNHLFGFVSVQRQVVGSTPGS